MALVKAPAPAKAAAKAPAPVVARLGSVDMEDTASVKLDLNTLANIGQDECGQYKTLMVYVNMILRGKKHLVPTPKLSQQLLLEHADKLANIVKDLGNDSGRATAAYALIKGQSYDDLISYTHNSKGCKRTMADDLTNSPTFNICVKTINNIPLPWLIALVKKHSNFPIDAAVLRSMARKSEVNIRQSLELISGSWTHSTATRQHTADNRQHVAGNMQHVICNT